MRRQCHEVVRRSPCKVPYLSATLGCDQCPCSTIPDLEIGPIDSVKLTGTYHCECKSSRADASYIAHSWLKVLNDRVEQAANLSATRPKIDE
jgi:hypothetical protein